jgi:hypothetical protein
LIFTELLFVISDISGCKIGTIKLTIKLESFKKHAIEFNNLMASNFMVFKWWLIKIENNKLS